MERLAAAIRILEGVTEWSGRLVAWLTLVLVGVTFAVVVLRYGFSQGWIALQESITYLHALVFMIGAAYTLRHDEHVRVDVFYQRLSEKGRAWVNILGSLALLLPMAGFLFWMSWDFVASSWALKEGSPEPGGLPILYLLKSLLLVMPALLIIQGLALIGRGALVLRGRPLPVPEHGEPEV